MAAPDYFQRKPSYHRTRSGLAAAGLTTPGSPHTPLLNRSLSSQLASPGGSYRVEEESLIYEIGSRSFRAGFAGDSAPRCIVPFGPQQSRRLHDFGPLSPTIYTGNDWAKDWELWDLDVRNVNLGLVEDRIERAVRVAHTNYLMLDQRARKVVLALPPTLPHPLIGAVLSVIFNSFQPSSVQLWATPVLCAISAGLRSALVIDIGWHETTVTALYEYREVLHRRSTRSAKMLTRNMADMLRQHTSTPDSVSFESTEDITTRMAWCRTTGDQHIDHDTPISLPLGFDSIDVPFSTLSEPAEETFFSPSTPMSQIDDHDLPIHLLAFKCLLSLPLDVRAICVSRILITGGASDLPGLKTRILREIEGLVKTKGWDPVMNYGSATEKRREKLQSSMSFPMRSKPPDNDAQNDGIESRVLSSEEQSPARDAPQERDDISDKLQREVLKRGPVVQGVVRGVETLGPWAGASLAANLKIDAAFEIKREEFLKNGIASLGNGF